MNILSTLNAADLIGEVKKQLLPGLQAQLQAIYNASPANVEYILDDELPKVEASFAAMIQSGIQTAEAPWIARFDQLAANGLHFEGTFVNGKLDFTIKENK